MDFECPICGGEEADIIATNKEIRFGCYGSDKNVVECLGCNTVQLYPQWTQVELEGLYSQYSKKKDFKGQKVKENINKYILDHIIVKKSDSILEIGCGGGDNVYWFDSLGYNVIGIDKDPTVADLGLCHNEDFFEYSEDNKFDFIYAMHVFEHMSNPYAFINKLTRHLNDGGKFLLELPSVDDPLLKVYDNSSYKKFCWYPYHLFFYSQESIKHVLESNHLRWLIFGKPGNVNFSIPLLDRAYKRFLTKVLKSGDTLIVKAEKCKGELCVT